MFYDQYIKLCAQKNVSKSKAAQEIGLNRAAVAKWEKGSIPHFETLTKIAEYFGVTVDYLMKGQPPAQQSHSDAQQTRGELSIDEEVNKLLSGLMDSKSLMLSGEIATPEAAEYLRNSLEAVYEQAKKINQERKKNE